VIYPLGGFSGGTDPDGGSATSDLDATDGAATCNAVPGVGDGSAGPTLVVCEDGSAPSDLLQSSAHCGACGHSCLGDLCINGLCQPAILATRRGSEWQFSGLTIVNGEPIFFTHNQSSTLELQTSTDAGVKSLGTFPFPSSFWGIVKEAAYWPPDFEVFMSNGVMHGDLGNPDAGFAPVTLFNPTNSEGFAYDDDSIFFVDKNLNQIYAVDRRTGAGYTVATSESAHTGIQVVSGNLYWLNEPTTTGGTGAITQFVLATKDTRTLAENLPDPSGFLASSEYIYYGTHSDENIQLMRLPRGGGTPEVLSTVPDPQRRTVTILRGGGKLFWFVTDDVPNAGSRLLFQVPECGGPPWLTARLGFFQKAATDGQYMYWTDGLSVARVVP
jgi:hypothetical protein